MVMIMNSFVALLLSSLTDTKIFYCDNGVAALLSSRTLCLILGGDRGEAARELFGSPTARDPHLWFGRRLRGTFAEIPLIKPKERRPKEKIHQAAGTPATGLQTKGKLVDGVGSTIEDVRKRQKNVRREFYPTNRLYFLQPYMYLSTRRR